jgi:hypothetical protein
MKPQFSIAAVFLATTFIAVACGAILQIRTWFGIPWRELPYSYLWELPSWLPIVFATYAIARRRFTVRLVIVFTVAEAVSLGAVYLALRYLTQNGS